ncbi:MAG: hypothetical protein KQ78_00387 [Candidatus Izimaplasma bacterium HR2]|nr:MAG: hypothetical protein KQ78_00387 [Candidatus Izimaplasma bacterium HR2]
MFKSKIKTEKAIVIEKKVILSTNKPSDGVNITRMKFGIYDSIGGNNKKKTTQYQVFFMTKKGRKSFLIQAQLYHQIKIDSLGLLERQGSKFVSFNSEKKVTKKDVELLNW